jgi:hypothetical protein
MAKPSKLSVMISSRCEDKFPSASSLRPLSEMRKDLKKEIEELQIFGQEFFEVWINEETPPQGGTWNSRDVCIGAAKDCDIFISLFSGNAGWAKDEGTIGICHAELMEALSTAPGKVRLVELEASAIVAKKEGSSTKIKAAKKRNKMFENYVRDQSLFRGAKVKTEVELKARVKAAVLDALLRLAQAGVRDASRGRFHSGLALDWSNLDFATRRKAMTHALTDAMRKLDGSYMSGNNLFVKLQGTDILVVPDAIPAALSVGAAKEPVGQPFLFDYKLAPFLAGNQGGPIHIIGCHKNASEAQAIKLLGVPDAIVVSPPFGVFVADSIQKVQFAFIANCRDEATTRNGVSRFFDWLKANKTEETRVVACAQSRAKIVAAIAKEVAS